MASYAAIAAPLALMYLPLQVLLPAFYARDLGLGFVAIGLALMAARFFDMFTDPIIGWACERFSLRGGYRRPWILIGTPPLLLAIFMLFLPPEGAGVGHILVWTGVLYLAGTVMIVPFNALGADIAVDYDDRNRATGWRTAFGIVGALLGLGVIAYATTGRGEAEGTQFALELTAMVGGGLLLIAAPLLFLVSDRRSDHPMRRPQIWGGFRAAFGSKGFPTLITAFTLNGIGNGVPAALFILYVGETLGNPQAAGPLLFLYFVIGVAAIPVWVRIARGRRKEQVWIASLAIACAGFLAVPFLGPDQIIVFAIICAITGAAFGADMVLPASMNADQARLFEDNGQTAQTGMFFGVWGTATKFAAAIGVGVGLLIIGFSDPMAAQGEADPLLLAFVYGWVPIMFKLAALLVIRRYPAELSAGSERI